VLAISGRDALRPTRERGLKAWSRGVATESVAAYKDGGEPAARSYVEDLESTQHVHAYIFRPIGQGDIGRMVFPWIEDMRRTGRVRHHSWLDSFLPERFLPAKSKHRRTELHAGFGISAGPTGYSVLMAFPALV